MHHEIRRTQLSFKGGGGTEKKERKWKTLEEAAKVSPVIIPLKELKLQMKLEYRRL